MNPDEPKRSARRWLPAIDPENVRASLLDLVLRFTTAIGVLICIPSVYFGFVHRLYGVCVIDAGGLVAIASLTIATRIPHRVRAASFCLILYAIGTALLMGVGAISQIYLFGFSVMTVLLLGLRVGLYAVALSGVTLLAVGVLGRAAPAMAPGSFPYDYASWIVITVNFTFVDALLTLAVGAVLAALDRALATEVAGRLTLKRTEADRALILAQLQLQIERMPLAYLLTDRDFFYTRWNPAAERLFGYTEREALGKSSVELIFPPETRAIVEQLRADLRAGSLNAHAEVESRTKDGRAIVCAWHNTPLFDDAGVFIGALSLAEDVTARKSLESQLRQSQKMEAVGRLAGGVAHDFNNLLSVVLSYSDMVLAEMPADAPMRGDVQEIRRAGARAADLTRQLLMFSRKQVIAPKVLALNGVLADIDKMLRRVVGEDIELTTVLAEQLGNVCIDPGSIEQVIMNLAVNARDAMPKGGKLTMETANVALDEHYAKTHLGAKPGAYVMLSVTDSGTGIDKATLARIFEPFFTTKEQGKGTGLGLSTVFGIVEQGGGSVWVYSEVGVGTTFKVYLPRVDARSDAPLAMLAASALRGSETVLLVEDEDQVRDVARGILVRYGYAVLEAHNAGEAILLSEAHEGPIHLLLSDVVMPKMSGPALAKRLAATRPAMKVLFMSGYTDDAAVRHGVIDAALSYLQKPITVDSLTRKVRGVLDSTRGEA